ncbi:high-affinity choline transporter 1-like [Bacillus rossius redtenbacheri]|uniref:high-affinity choline transporter 1-like n=1 Tax=Bacillus rossius redtenbacheri TaxID=93214 RepID=UPI002FDD9253
MAVFVGGVIAILLFYGAVLAVGVWAGTKQKNHGQEEVMLAGRSLGMFVGVLTLIATWVGGGFINGTAEAMFTNGLSWCQMPFGYSLSLLFGVLLFVKKMRAANYITMLDPFQNMYGARTGSLLFFPALMADVFWVGAILNALGSSLMVILGLNITISVIVSAVFAGAYTMAGGLYSVSYTDVIQLFLIVIGLVLAVPFAYHDPSVSQSAMAAHDWLGHVEPRGAGLWVDNFLLLVFGGIPWQAYVQRILSIRSTHIAQVMSFGAVIGCFCMAIPAAIAGIIGRGADWPNVPGFERNVTDAEASIILPLVMRYLTPNWVACLGLGAISAAAMSSADACILSSSSMFSRNIYKVAVRTGASDLEVLWVMRCAIVAVTTLATVIALTVESIYYLSFLCSDLVYVILFPQLLLVVHWSQGVNSYGCLSSYAVGLVLRLLCGEPGLGIPVTIELPLYDADTKEQLFPFRTLCMLCTMVTHAAVSRLAREAFTRGWLPRSWDVLGAFSRAGEAELAASGEEKPVKMGLHNPVFVEDSCKNTHL